MSDAIREATRACRLTFGGGIVCWAYDYWNRAPVDHAGIASGLELGVQLSGQWRHAGRELGEDVFGAGEIHRINVGESWATRFASPHGTSRQVGFALYPADLPALASPADAEIAFAGDKGRVDRRLFELARWIAECADHPERAQPRASEVEAELLSYVRRTCVSRPIDPIVRARQEIDRHLGCELKMEHIAEIANVHPDTFARRFRRRYGMPPVRYRLKTRLDQAGRLLGCEPERSVASVAEACGFPNLPFFFRQFRRTFQCTPAEYARRHGVDARRQSAA